MTIMRKVANIILIQQMSKWGTKAFTNFPKVIQLQSSKVEIQIRVCGSRLCFLIPTLLCSEIPPKTQKRVFIDKATIY